MSNPAKKIVEDVLGPARTRALWTANYYTALPFTPQSFEVGALLPTILFMARFGHRRGKGRFAETFGSRRNEANDAPTIASVCRVLAANAEVFIEGFNDDVGHIMLGDLLLSWCQENKQHEEGQDHQVQRVLPTHYFASWIDLPDNTVHLRGIPELLVSILASQPDGTSLIDNQEGAFPIGVTEHHQNPLLASFGRYCRIRGRYTRDVASDFFSESEAVDIGIDELLTIRMAHMCGHAPKMARGDSSIPNRVPIATRAVQQFREDMRVFIFTCVNRVPRQAFLQMFEAGTGLGLLSLTLSSARMLIGWERVGKLPKDAKDESPWPLFVDASNGQDETLRELSEASMAECLRRFERVPIILMVLRILDDQVRRDRHLADKLPPDSPDSRDYLNLLGEIYHDTHPRSEAVLDKIFEDSRRLGEQFGSSDPELAERLSKGAPWDLAEVLCDLMTRKLQMTSFLSAIDSFMLTDKPNGFASRRRSRRMIAGHERTVILRSVLLSSALLDFLVHRHLQDATDMSRSRPLSLERFLAVLRNAYGFYVDQELPGQSNPADVLRRNKAWLERRLRDLGLLIGVNDAESMKQLRPRYQGGMAHAD